MNATQVVNDLENKLDNLKIKAQNRIATLNKMEEKKNRFVEIENQLGKSLTANKIDLEKIISIVPTAENVDQIILDLTTLNDKLQNSVPLRDHMHDEGAQLMREDIASMPAVQESILILDKRWDEIQQDITRHIHKYIQINQELKDYVVAKKRFGTEIDKAQAIFNSIEPEPAGEQQLLQTAEKSKSALDQIKKSKATLDDMERKGNNLLKLFESIDNVIPNNVSDEIKTSHIKWQQLHEQIAKNAHLFETEAIIWNQIDELKAELIPWLDETIQSMNNAVDNTLEIEYGPIRLNKYRTELPSYLSIKNDIFEKIAELTKINKDLPIPALSGLEQSLNEKFATAEEGAKNLQEASSSFEEQEKDLRAAVKKCGEAINRIREGIIKCDDMSGDNNKIAERLQTCQALKAQLLDQESDFDNLKMRVDEMKFTYPTFAESIIPKEMSNVQKRLDGITVHANKIEASLLQFLKKFHTDKIGMLKRLISVQKEKIAWCVPEPASDKYNLEVKKSSMNEVQKGIVDCLGRQKEIEASIGLLNEIDSPENIDAVRSDVAKMKADLSEIQQNYKTAKNALDENILLWNQYEQQADAVTTWLKDTETKVKNEAASQLELGNIDEKVKELIGYDETIRAHKPQIDELEKTAKAIMEKNFEARCGQIAKHVTARHQTIAKSIGTLLDRSNNAKKTYGAYNQHKATCTDWLKNARIYYNELARMHSPGGSGPTREQLELVKAYVNNLPGGQAHINDLVNSAEALYPVVTSDDRDRIRNEVRQLREDFDNIHDEANSLLSQVESLLIQKTTIEESYLQVKQWLTDSQKKLGNQNDLYPTLADKKGALQKFKSQLQDNNLHKNALKQLQDKSLTLADIEAGEKVKESIKQYDTLSQNLNQRVSACEGYVGNHESYNQVIERAQDWLKGLKLQTVDIFNDDTFEKDGAAEKLKTLDNVLAERKPGDKIINACQNQLEKVLVETFPSGHPALINAYENCKRDWDAYINQCEATQAKLNDLCTKWSAFDNTIGAIDDWLKKIENIVKDQSLKSTSDTKQAHLNKLQRLNEEIASKAPEFTALLNQSQGIVGENDINPQVSRLNTRYQTLKNLCKENISRYEQYAKEHNQFNDDYEKFKHHLQQAIKELNENSEIVGDLGVLQARQNAIRDISERRINDASTFENIIDSGEKLYVHTNPEGREIIRQQLRSLRTDWDHFSDDLNSSSQRIEQCLLQFSDFTVGQEQLTKWLKDVEKSMQNHTELKTTLQEKRAQLQNHKLMNQDILSHNLLVETVCDKAQSLVDQTHDESLNVYLHSIKQLFANIVEKSQDLLTNLDGCVHAHHNYNNQLVNLKSWLNGEKQKLVECEDTFGEKADIKRKIGILDQLKNNKENGLRQLEDLLEQAEIVKKCTSPKGVEIVEKELAELEEEFNNHFDEVDVNKQKQNEILQQCNDFDKSLDELTKWCRATETIFRDQQLQSTVDEKSNQLAVFKEHRDQIVQKQKNIDSFTDQAHNILNSTGAERLKTLTSQLTNRYQLLQVLSKEVVNRWQALLEDHRKYNDKLNEVNAWFGPIEKQLQKAFKEEPSGAEVANILENLNNEIENAETLLSTLDSLGEKALPETSTQGREKIRQELRDVREHWDKLNEDIQKLKKLQEAQSLQLSSYQDFLQQTLGWLDTNETQFAQENTNTWTSPQEIRSKLMKYKTASQDIAAHKRIIETVNEKANAIIQNNATPSNVSDIKKEIADINSRYEQLNQKCNDIIAKLDEAMDVYQKFNDLQKHQLDYQKNLWDRLQSYTDYSGSKVALQARQLKIDEIENLLGEGEQKLKELSDHVEQKAKIIPSRCKEVMARDLTGLKVDFDKFKETLQGLNLKFLN